MIDIYTKNKDQSKHNTKDSYKNHNRIEQKRKVPTKANPKELTKWQ